MNIVIPITNLRPPLVQGLVSKHTQKDEYTHANPTGTHTHRTGLKKNKIHTNAENHICFPNLERTRL